jgi:hypothetical protein
MFNFKRITIITQAARRSLYFGASRNAKLWKSPEL